MLRGEEGRREGGKVGGGRRERPLNRFDEKRVDGVSLTERVTKREKSEKKCLLKNCYDNMPT